MSKITPKEVLMMKKSIRLLLIIFFVAIVSVNGYQLFEIARQYVGEIHVKAELEKFRPVLPKTKHSPIYNLTNLALESIININNNYKTLNNMPNLINTTEKQLNKNITALQNEVNKDVAGWLTIPNTNVDYPFVLSKDNDYYLRRDIFRNYATAGTLFMDFRCVKDFSDFNTIIYGHNMKNGSMFSDLEKYADPLFFESNSPGFIFLDTNTYELKIIAYMIVRADDKIIYNPLIDRSLFFEYVKNNADNFREPNADGNIITLSTCTNNYKDTRIVVIGEYNIHS